MHAVVSQFHPKMLALLFLPWAVSLVLWGLIAWFAWTPLTQLFAVMLAGDSGWMATMMSKLSLSDAHKWLASALAFMLIVPMMFVTAMVIMSVFAMPAVIRYLSSGDYKDLAQQGSLSIASSGLNVLRTLLVFIPGYLLSIPLWFIPVVGLLVPVLWWGWLNARIMRFDSLTEHATPGEREALISKNSKSYLLIGVVVSALNYIPPLFLLTPILCALAFGHFSLSLLRNCRR